MGFFPMLMRSLGHMLDADNQFWMGSRLASQLQEISHDPSVLSDGNFWAVVISFEGEMTFARFAEVTDAGFPDKTWKKLDSPWKSSLSKGQYITYVQSIRESIADGSVYQVNACRELKAAIADSSLSLQGLFAALSRENPAPFSQYLKIPGLEIASATPERLLKRDGNLITTSPIKGTMTLDSGEFGDKDKAENLMIVDLMRNDFGRICAPGSVEVAELFRTEVHPGLKHLVSDVIGTLATDISWSEIFDAIIPAGSVSGAPKSSALEIISRNEGVKRGPYCGALGWVQGDQAQIAVGIRTFWSTGDNYLRFGTGAGITWGSDPDAEWEETQLKARRLISIAGGELA
jgi:para-aminobenzoate synthetase component 1